MLSRYNPETSVPRRDHMRNFDRLLRTCHLLRTSTDRVRLVHLSLLLYYEGGSYGYKVSYKNLDLIQDFPNKISFHFLWVKMLPKNLPRFSDGRKCVLMAKSWPKIFKWQPCTKILGRETNQLCRFSHTENCKTLLTKRTQHMYGGDCDAAIAKAAAAVTHVQSQSQEVLVMKG